MKNIKLWGLGLEIAIAIVIGLVTTYWVSGVESFIIGLIVFFCIELVRIRIMTEETFKKSSNISSLLALMQPVNPVAELTILFGLKNLAQLNEHTISVTREKSWEFWRQCVLRAKMRWAVISYSVPEEGWALAWNNAGLALQAERVSNGCRIERVFLVESEKEITELKEVMHQQAAIGIEVKYIFRKSLKSPRIEELAKKIGTLDFAIVDGSWVFLSDLDKNRKVVSVGASIDADVIKSASDLFEEIFFLANSVEDISESQAHETPD